VGGKTLFKKGKSVVVAIGGKRRTARETATHSAPRGKGKKN